MGGITIYGNTLIIGAIAGKEVYATESYDGLAACPDFGGVTGNLNQTVVVVVGGISETAECTNQTTMTSSSTGHYKDPGRKPHNYIGKSKSKGTYDEYDGSCLITAIDTDGTLEVCVSSSAFRFY